MHEDTLAAVLIAQLVLHKKINTLQHLDKQKYLLQTICQMLQQKADQMHYGTKSSILLPMAMQTLFQVMQLQQHTVFQLQQAEQEMPATADMQMLYSNY